MVVHHSYLPTEDSSNMYVNCHTYYSFRYGTLSVQQLLEQASALGLNTLTLTDINNTSACLDFVRQAPRYNIRPILGIDFRLHAKQLFIGIAKNNQGFTELNHYLSALLHNESQFTDEAPKFENAYIVYPFEKLAKLRPVQLQPHEYIGVRIWQLNQLRFSQWREFSNKLIVLHTVSFYNKSSFNAHRLLRAIDKNTLLSKLPKSEEGKPSDRMLATKEILEKYKDFPNLVFNTEKLLASCEIHFDFDNHTEHRNLQHYTKSHKEDVQMLRQLCQEGLKYRYPRAEETILKRLEKELDIIEKKQFVSYFLINWDIVNYARSKGYYYVGRGSGANSIIAYLLRITDVDPVELDLYFERFINLFRKNPPDFDIDFSWKDRDDITDYIFHRFPHVSLLATYNTFQYRAVVREMGKVFGLPKHEIDILTEGKKPPQRNDEISRLVLKYSQLIHGFPSHLSIHAGGILITDKAIQHLSATFLPPKGYATCQFDMHIAEDVGVYKFDILSQRGLGKIKDAIEIIKYNQPDSPKIDIHDIDRFKTDKKVKHILRNAEAMGCFYVESPAMRMLMKKLEVDHYLGLVAASSIIRPGVAKSGMMREYILCYRQPERRKEAAPVLWDLMPETYGIMVYQEDVIKVAHYFAGLTLGEADHLRRGMSGKFRSREEFQKTKLKFFQNCHEKGHDKNLTADIWRQMESFAGYAFAKGHSASYAVESYQSLFLKAHYPLEFMVAVINNSGGFYSTEFYFHEARMLGATIHAPCINQSDGLTSIYNTDIYVGFVHINGIESKVITDIITERNLHGIFIDFDDFIDRVPISVEQITLLIRIDAFRFTKITKQALLWQAHLKLNKRKKDEGMKTLFQHQRKQYILPTLKNTAIEETFDQIEILGFPLNSPFDLIEKEDQNTSFIFACDMKKHIGKSIHLLGYLITTKRTKANESKDMYFGTFYDKKGDIFDTVHFPPVAIRFPFRGKGIYHIIGKVTEEFDVFSLEAQWMEKIHYINIDNQKSLRPSNERIMKQKERSENS